MAAARLPVPPVTAALSSSHQHYALEMSDMCLTSFVSSGIKSWDQRKLFPQMRRFAAHELSSA